MLQIFVPATLVVFISWVSFWINPDSAPSRTVIGTMTILSETHLLTGTNRRLPPVSYIKVHIMHVYCPVVSITNKHSALPLSNNLEDLENQQSDEKLSCLVVSTCYETALPMQISMSSLPFCVPSTLRIFIL
ncbi:unnamed protein product [Anisakis simplex]|uniref:Neur_chan_memb domain-containing protein n=1 Tax=Anisakis simplex TaxID=6269 RepID=A0A0M3J4R3_ANISI|nr:unnamed protein product [Anisakis simplex]